MKSNFKKVIIYTMATIGDINSDGEITSADALYILQIVVGLR